MIGNQNGGRPTSAGLAVILAAWTAAASLSVASLFAFAAPRVESPTGSQPPAAAPTAPLKGQLARTKQPPDRRGREVGKASFYASRYGGRTMSNGKPMNLDGDNAASLTLPLGTRAEVKNLANGQTAVVSIEDRGPYVRGRIIDLSPRTARSIGITARQGLAWVQVTPLAIPRATAAIKTAFH